MMRKDYIRTGGNREGSGEDQQWLLTISLKFTTPQANQAVCSPHLREERGIGNYSLRIKIYS
jgi:hypothetical protein